MPVSALGALASGITPMPSIPVPGRRMRTIIGQNRRTKMMAWTAWMTTTTTASCRTAYEGLLPVATKRKNKETILKCIEAKNFVHVFSYMSSVSTCSHGVVDVSMRGIEHPGGLW
ncbi:hypothetical protein SETIT_6G160600v2 [Setaria italica]|uniref:Uncharacterized protein n=1 Tax=Setaria italica TaxID=4555 RepID=A0A368RM08_SETIT|nr:hypothetical protein SETIT_6G160600v2 [Setaria italica]